MRSIVALPKWCLRWARLLLFLSLDSFCRLVPSKGRPVSLILRLDALGDFFIWLQSGALEVTDFARQGSSSVALIANEVWADYARELGLWDEVVAIDPWRMMRDPLYRLRTLLAVRSMGAQRLIQPRSGRVFLQEDAIARTCGAASRIGNAGTLINITSRVRRWGGSFYTTLIRVNELQGGHEIQRNREFTTALTGIVPKPYRLSSGGRRSPEYVAVALGAGEVGRVWPAENLIKLVGYLGKRYPSLKIMLLGTKEYSDVANRIQEDTAAEVENLVGSTNVQTYVRLVSGATLTICNDSSAYHIATIFNGRVLCFLGGGQYGWFGPYPEAEVGDGSIALSERMECFWCNWRCRFPRAASGAYRCLARIPISAATAALDRLLGCLEGGQ